MSKIFFLSDLHLNHNKEFLYKPRGFTSIEEHNKAIIKNINTVVGENDILYSLGDEMMGDNEIAIELFKQIKCKNIKIIIGNHTTDTRIALLKKLPNVISVEFGNRLKYKKITFIISHYPTLVGNFDDPTPVWNLSGHTHAQTKFYDNIPKCYNVSMDAHNCFPTSLDEIVQDIKEHKIAVLAQETAEPVHMHTCSCGGNCKCKNNPEA